MIPNSLYKKFTSYHIIAFLLFYIYIYVLSPLSAIFFYKTKNQFV